MRDKLISVHYEALDAQVSVLEQRMTEEDVEDLAAVEDWPDAVYNAAEGARMWMEGDEDESPSSKWDELIG